MLVKLTQIGFKKSIIALFTLLLFMITALMAFHQVLLLAALIHQVLVTIEWYAEAQPNIPMPVNAEIGSIQPTMVHQCTVKHANDN